MFRRRLALTTLAAFAATSGVAREAAAVDLPPVDGSPVTLDVTETSIVAQRFAARQGEQDRDQGYFTWLNRLNMVLGWKHFTVGARIDTALYANRPLDRAAPGTSTQVLQGLYADGASRYRNEIYPAKLWVTYKNDGIEATVGDSYVQYGRGLVLSLRKVDELGIDTTLFGGKVTLQKDPFSVSIVAGFTNPSRVDEPTGRALFTTQAIPAIGNNQPVPSQPIFGSDRIVGAQFQAGRGLPVILSTHAAMLTKCAPYRYGSDGNIVDDQWDRPFGTCEEKDRQIWLASLPNTGDPILAARETINAGQSIEVPSLWGHGSVYVEGVIQKRNTHVDPNHDEGNALYASLVNNVAQVTNTIEMKSYRNFYPLSGGVNGTVGAEFANVAYSIPATAEPITSDVMFGFFNACVTGARDRFDYRFSPSLLGYATFGYFVSRSEILGGACDRFGKSTGQNPMSTTDNVTDGSLGMELRFNHDESIALANVSARHDITDEGTPYYREVAAQYTVTKHIKGPYSFEISGRHRYRVENGNNIHGSDFRGEPWWEGEHYNALKVAPKWVFTQGFEYTSFIGLPTYYVNGGVLYKFTSQSNVRLYAGQNRGGLRCVSGVCRVFPEFSGARLEVTLRF